MLSNDPPSSSVAEVSTTVAWPNSCSRSSPATDIGARYSTAGRRSVAAVAQSTSDGPAATTRPAISCSSSTAALAWVLAGSTPPSGADLSLPAVSVSARCPTSRTATSASNSSPRTASSRPGPHSARPSPSASPARTSASWVSGATYRLMRRAARSTAPAVSSSVTAPVARSTSSCASSTTTTSCSGSNGMPANASMASIAWLVTTTSARRARSRASSAKHASAVRAPGRPDALVGGDRRRPPGTLGRRRHQLVAVAGPGLVGPGADPQHVPAQRGRRRGREQRVLVRAGASSGAPSASRSRQA